MINPDTSAKLCDTALQSQKSVISFGLKSVLNIAIPCPSAAAALWILIYKPREID